MRRYKAAMGNIKVGDPLCTKCMHAHREIGTWVPQDKAEVLAKKYNVYHLLKPILIFKLGAGDKSPPPAPKHTTAASNKTKPAKPPVAKKVASMFCPPRL